MKKIWKVLAAVAVVAFGATAMASCDKDEDEEFVDGGASRIAGSYSGTLKATVMSTPCDFDGAYDLVLSKQNGIDDEVTVTIPECTYQNDQMPGGFVIPSVVVPDVDVKKSTKDSNLFVLDDEEFDTTTIGGMKISGKINGGRVTGSQIELTYTITPGKMGMPINFTFTGNLK